MTSNANRGTRRGRAGAVAAVALCTAMGIGTSTAATRAAASTQAPVVPVGHVSLRALPGLWYQISAIPAPFEQGCAKDVTATYGLLPDGLLSLHNDCVLADGSVRDLAGEIRIADPGRNAEFEVSFTQVGGVYQFPSTPNRIVMGVGPCTSWLAVGTFDHSGGVVLARTPELSAHELAKVDAVLIANGYTPSAFVPTPQG
jgi:apolipoprotein D and lipocalin family protein